MKIRLRLLLAVLLSSFYYLSTAQTPSWTNLGPIPFPVKTIGQVHGIGRCSQIKFHPTNANKMYVASASGGIYYSGNKGVNWSILGTDLVTKTQSASIAIDPTNDQNIYWGTGDANYYGSGVGVYKTTNGGGTWTLSNTGMGNRLVIEMIIDPANTQNILAATNNGIYKSIDGGANWTLKSASGLQFQDMVLKPIAGTQIVYACTKSAFYISTDWGNTWNTTGTGLVMDGSGARIAVSAANSSVVYVGITKAYGAIFKSTDGGANFASMRTETTQNLTAYNATDTDGGQGNYNFDIVANPADANELYLCSHTVWRTLDGGGTWSHQQTSWASNLHTDEHQILFDPYVSGQIWNANDGGVWSNNANGTGPWAPMSDGIAATEIYHAAICKINRQLFYIGTQDNGGFYYSNGTWYNDRGGDWGPAHWFDYSSNYVYYDETPDRDPKPSGSNNNLNFPFTASSSSRTLYAFTPANTNIAYVANTGKVYRCSNLTSSTPSWTLIYTVPSGNIKDIQADLSNADELYVFTDQPALYRSDNATSTASFITVTVPNTSTSGSIAPIPNSNIVFIGQGSSIYRSADQGATWSATSGFPSASIKKVVADPKSSVEAVYACYNLGVYYKDNTISSWANYSSGLPIIAGISDMDVFNDGITQGAVNIYYYGRGTWQSPLVTPPSNISVALTSPANNSVFNGPANITLTATASTTSGSISKVEFYNGTTLLATSTSSPFTYSWNGVIPGSYDLTAVAYDNLGNKKNSSPVNITVNFVCSQVSGTTFGTSPAYAAGSEYDKAYDGSTSTFFDYNGANGGYTGLDLGTAQVVNAIRFYPRSGQEGRMNGGIFQGSNTSSSTGFVNLYTIPSQPNSGWNNVSIANSTAYRYYRYLSPSNGYCNVAEVQFCASNQAPVVSITAPSNNTSYPSGPATVNITATASDADGTISKIEFYQGTTLIGTDASSPYTFSWTGVANGAYQLTAIAYDNLNAKTTSSIITIYVGNQNPTVAITSPQNYVTLSQPATFAITVTASDVDGTISKVEFYNGSTLLGTATTSPYFYVWSGVGVGNYILTAKAYDNSTGVATSSIVNVTVSSSVCNPIAGTSSGTGPGYYATSTYDKAFDGNVSTYFCNASWSGGYTQLDLGTAQIVKSLQYYPQWASSGYATGGIFQASNDPSFATGVVTLYTIATQPPDGWNYITLSNNTAYRYYRYSNPSGGYCSMAEIQFCASNKPPVVAISSPANNTTYPSSPATVSITAAASDPDGTIAKVDFYQGAVLIGTSVTSPYTITWNSVAAGSYQLTAVATDNNGATATSSIVNINVSGSSITPTITYNNATKVYGDLPFAMTATSNSPGAMTYSISAGSAFASINASTGQVTILGAGTVTIQVSQAASGSYTAATQTATLTINKAILTATADPKSRIYNTANPSFTITYTGFVNGDNGSAITAPSASTTATISSNVGTYPISLTGGSAANYTITLVSGTLTITQATPTLTYTGPTSGTVGAVLALTATTNSTGAITYSIANGTGTATLAGSNLTLNTAGTVALTVSVAANGNYATATINQTITINSLTNPTITYNNVTKIYGDVPFAMTATSNSPGTLTYSITAGGAFASINASTGQVSILGAGSVTVQVSQAPSGSYAAATKTATLTISKASLTATATNQSRVYNTGNPSFTFTYSGFVNGENSSIITTSPSASTTATISSNVGTYPITLTGGSAANYNITLVSGTLTITQATPTLTYSGPTSGTVGSVLALTATTNSTGAISYSVANGTGTATLSGSNLTLNTTGAVTVTVSVAANSNYAAASVTQTITINALITPTITYNNVTKIYGDVPFAMSATSNSPGAMTYSITSGSSFANINSSNGQVTILGAGTVTVQVSQAASGSYAAATQTATLTINKASLTVTADPKSRVYNTANPALTITYAGFVNGETASVITTPTASTSATISSNVGTYPITLTGGSATNYTISLVNGTLTITQVTPTLTYIGPTSGTVGSVLALTATTNSTGAISYSVANGTGTATLSGSNLTLNTTGTVTITVAVAANGNYAASSITQTFTINSLTAPTITYGNVTKIYGDAPFAMTATSNSTGVMTYSITLGTSFASINASTGQVTILGAGTVTVQVSQAASGSYSAATQTATLTINKASLTATADAKSRSYNSANPTFTITYTGLVNGDNASAITSPTASTTATISSNVGTYPITLTGGSAANYAITLVNGTLTITQAPPTGFAITSPNSGTVGNVFNLTSSSPSGGAVTWSIISGTGASLSGNTLTLNSTGTITIQATQAASGNYAASTVTQTITISAPVNPTITYNSVTKVYGNASFTMTATSNSSGAMTYSITSGSSFASINASTGQVTILGAGTVTVQVSQAASGSYAAAIQTATLTINKASLNATADAKSRMYNTANPALTITYSGFVNGDNAAAITAPTATTIATISSNVGTYPITLSGGSAANYTITLVNGTLTVSQATPSLSYTGATSGTAGAVLALSATSNSTGAISYSVSNGTGTATLSGSNLTLSTAGTVTLTVSVAANGNFTAASITQTITINANQSPVVSITSPANNTNYTAPASFILTVTASDPDGTISKVEFYNGTSLIGTSTTSPYNYALSNVGAGTYTISAKAYDNLGAVSTSSPITLIVNTCAYTSWSASSIYVATNRCERNGNVYEAKWWTQNNDPLTNSNTYDVWKYIGPCGSDLMPSMVVNSTASGTTMSSPASFTIDVIAHDDEGSVTKVEFYSGTTLVNQIMGANGSYNFNGLSNGIYQIYVKVYDNAGNVAVSDTLKYTIQSATATNNPISYGRLNMYPNPVTGNDVTFDYPVTTNGHVFISIVDVNGKEWYKVNEDDGNGLQKTINVDFLPPGAYIVKLRIAGKEYHEKLVKPSRPKMK